MSCSYCSAGVPARDTQRLGSEQPSAQVKGVWDSMVSWMKTAVDFIAKVDTAEADPSSPGIRGKVTYSAVLLIQ